MRGNECQLHAPNVLFGPLPRPHRDGALLRAGVDDWGGVSPLTPDHVNPERPWPQVDDLARLSAEAGFTLRERLTAHPSYVLAGVASAVLLSLGQEGDSMWSVKIYLTRIKDSSPARSLGHQIGTGTRC